MLNEMQHYTHRTPIHPICRVAWSPNRERLAFGEQGGDVHVWDVSTQRISMTCSAAGHQGCGYLGWSPDGNWLLSSYWDGTVALWKVANGELHQLYHEYESGPIVAWSADGKYVAYGGPERDQETISLRETPGEEKLAAYILPERSTLGSLAWSSSGAYLASGGIHYISGGTTEEISIWDPFSGRLLYNYLQPFSPESALIKRMAWSPDEQTLACGNSEGVVYIWKVPEGELLSQYHQRSVRTIKWMPDNKYLVSAGENIHVWEVATASTVAIYRGPYAGNDDSAVLDVDWLPNLQMVATVGVHHSTMGQGGFLSVWKPGESISKTQEEELFAIEEQKREFQRQQNEQELDGKPTTLSEFAQELQRLGLTPREAMNLLQVKNLNHLNYQEAFEQILRLLHERQQDSE